MCFGFMSLGAGVAGVGYGFVLFRPGVLVVLGFGWG